MERNKIDIISLKTSKHIPRQARMDYVAHVLSSNLSSGMHD
jgi:hypothetical protein